MDKILALLPMREGAEFFKDYFAGWEDIDVVSLDQGAKVITTRVDYALAGFDSVRKAREAEKSGYKAIIILCLGDPNMFSLREAVRIPVLGPLQTAWHFCSMLAGRFSIVSPGDINELAKHDWEDLWARYKFKDNLVSARQIPFRQSIGEIGKLSMQKPIPEELIQLTLDTCIKAIEEDEAPAVTFGCTFISAIVDEVIVRLKAKGVDVPVINPVPLTMEVARFLIKMKLSHSAKAFPLANPLAE